MESFLENFGDLTIEPPQKRNICSVCSRPTVVCWCPFLPENRIDCSSRIILLQHPGEEKRNIRTAPMLSLCLNSEKFIIYKGVKFPQKKHNGLDNVFQSPTTILLYPSNDAIDISELPKVNKTTNFYNILIIDSTWPQATNIYNRSSALHSIQKVKLSTKDGSKYVIRTQPSKRCLSTIETAAESLSVLENRPEIYDILMKPLSALCQYQLYYGAVHHDSREYHRIRSKIYPENVGKKLKKYLSPYE